MRNTTFRPGDLVVVDRPPLSGTNTVLAIEIATSAYNKLMLCSLGPFRVIAVRSHSLVIHEHDLHNTISTDRATRASYAPAAHPNNPGNLPKSSRRSANPNIESVQGDHQPNRRSATPNIESPHSEHQSSPRSGKTHSKKHTR